MKKSRLRGTDARRRLLCGLMLALSFWSAGAKAQSLPPGLPASLSERLSLSTDSVSPARFVAVHGRRSVVMGYPLTGLEVWAYPFQILADYQIGFKPIGAAAELDGRLLLRNIDYHPDSVTRTYIGPDFLVHEKLFVPLDDAAAVIAYEVEGKSPLDIQIHFQPVLNLMWPGALGGQFTRWSDDDHGYVIAEPSTGTSAVVGSKEIDAHDPTVNSTVHVNGRLSLSLRPRIVAGRPATAELFIALHTPDDKAPQTVPQMSEQLPQREAEASSHYDELASKALQIHTPEDSVNRMIEWSEVALDQAWVCNARLGCGMIAGYGPSRDARRPQYDWFFGGDGLIAANALVSAGQYSRAKEELSFVKKYQQPETGMIWHELSQSAGYIDWSKYPYMYVHVDISFDYLSAVARYVRVSGDTVFATETWASISAAYRYCRSLIRDADHLPHIPADKEGGDEQARPADDLGLSGAWVTAASGFAELAQASGHAEVAAEALKESELARQSIPAHYWDAETNFWIAGHTQTGRPIGGRRHGPTQLLVQSVFSPQQNEALLDQLASSDFVSDWGVRELAVNAPDYDPYSYGRGSVSALSTAGAATTFWQAHRPTIGLEIWRELLPWTTLDSLGHVHEVLAGTFYHEQTESVPEQTWSSAGVLDATIRGLLGLDIQGAANLIHLSPHLPADWDQITVANVRLPHSVMAFTIHQSMTAVDLDLTNEGSPAKVIFEPQIPLGAHLLGAECEGRKVQVDAEHFSEDQHARMTLAIPSGRSRCRVQFKGGVSIILDPPPLHPGDTSTALKLTRVELHGQSLTIEADTHPSADGRFLLRTPWKITSHEGAIVRSLNDDEHEVQLDRPASQKPGEYGHTRTILNFAE